MKYHVNELKNQQAVPEHDLSVLCPDGLKNRFGLSNMEAQVCYHLCLGTSLEGIAQLNNRGLSTVRSQLNSLFRKTDTSRQAQLVSYVFRELIQKEFPRTSNK